MGIFSFVQDALADVVKAIIGQSGLLGQVVLSPIKAIVQQVLGGVWKGNGATAFVNELNGKIIPMLTNLGNANTNYGNAIQKSIDHMLQGFTVANSLAKSLHDEFNNIF